MSLSGGGGATYIDVVDNVTGNVSAYWTPSAYATARIDIGRSWNLAADARRGVTVLQGITPDPFVGYTGLLSVGGYFSRSIEGVFSGGYSNGVTGQDPIFGVGRYDNYSGTAQLRFRLSRFWSTIVNVNHYEYRLNSGASRGGLTSERNQNSVQVGVSWSVPLIGTYLDNGGRN
jgi:hypothetical protein